MMNKSHPFGAEAARAGEPMEEEGQDRHGLHVWRGDKEAGSGSAMKEDELTARRRGVNRYSDAMVAEMAERGVAERGDSVLDAARDWEEKHVREITPGEILEPLKAASEWIFIHGKYSQAGADVLKPNEFGLGTSRRKRLGDAIDVLRGQMIEAARWLKTHNQLKGIREAVSHVTSALTEAKRVFDEVRREVEQEK